MSRLPDFQKQVYAWQHGIPQFTGRPCLEKPEAEDLIIRSCIQYETMPPKVKYLKKCGNTSVYRWRPHKISFVWHHLNDVLVLHETAHAIAVKRVLAFGHGPTFIGIFQSLLLDRNTFKKKFLKGSMDAYGIPWMPITPKTIGMTRRKHDNLQ